MIILQLLLQVMHPEGRMIMVGTRKGYLQAYNLPRDLHLMQGKTAKDTGCTPSLDCQVILLLKPLRRDP